MKKKALQLFVGKCGEADRYREEGRKERGRHDFILMGIVFSSMFALPGFLNDDDDERYSLL
jgi:hypothetical protein